MTEAAGVYAGPTVEGGTPAPLGASVRDGGVNFSVFSRDATLVELLLFSHAEASRPARIIPLTAARHRTYHYWHAFVDDLGPGQVYGFRAHGPYAPDKGLRFDPGKLLLDPYGRAVVIPRAYDRLAGAHAGDNCSTAMRSVVTAPRGYNWEGDAPLGHPFVETVIYELHVGAFTRHASSGVTPEKRGCYAGVIDKIPYLKDLGVTAVELLPIMCFDPQNAPQGRVNDWGYQPVSFFAPHPGYSCRTDPPGVLDEFRDMVKALHRAGIEVILDVVYNHSAEGRADGPTQCFRGLGNDCYYILDRDRSQYADFSGCGNTLNANQPIVRRMIQDSLRYWVTEMHVDGFRFDLASILSRDEDGAAIPRPPVLWDIESDPLLAGTKLIAEAWDAAGLYQVGQFVGDAWQEWNGRFRDDVRRFVKGDDSSVSGLATRLLGSPDLYGHEQREPEQSVNFVTCHDGFTLNDLVSYDCKHNEANGENNRDGANDNHSWNCGIEGPTDDPTIEALRNRQVKNFLAVTMLAVGTPMVLMGDEVRRTQRGNNNAYCRNDDITSFDWRLLERHADVHRFLKLLIDFRKRRDVVSDTAMTLQQLLQRARITWHGVELNRPDWSPHSHSLAFTLETLQQRFLLHAMFNAYWEPLTFALPPIPCDGRRWRRCLDTGLASPQDIQRWQDAPPIAQSNYTVQPRSTAVMAVSLTLL